MEQISIVTLTDQDISSPLLLHTYTSEKDRVIIVEVFLSGLQGNDFYKACITKQDGVGSGMYQSPTFFVKLELGTTTAYITTDAIPIEKDSIIKVYAEGAVADTLVGAVVKIFNVSKKRLK